MNAEEARRIWESEVEKEAQKFIDHIEKKILSDTYQQNISIYLFNYTDFADSIDNGSDEFTKEVFKRTVGYFNNLGFHVKADSEKYQIWIAYLKKDLVRSNTFIEQLTSLIEMKKYFRFNLKKNILQEIEMLIKEKATRVRQLEYDLIINIPNENSLLLDDLEDILEQLKKAGFDVSIISLEKSLLSSSQDIGAFSVLEIFKTRNESIFEEKKLRLIIKW